MRTRAAILSTIGLPRPYASSRPLEIADVELDPPQAGELLISVRAAGLCHSDLSVIDGTRPRPLPMVLGHEAAGVVEEVGAGVNDIRVGDHVITTFVPSCGLCEPCLRQKAALCEPGARANQAGTLISGARRLHRHGTDVNHHLGVSAFAEHAVVSRNSVVKVDSSLPFSHAALFGCAVITGVGAVFNTANVEPESSIAIVGLGGIGLAAVMGAKARRAAALIAVDLSDQKLAIASELGATLCVNARTTDCAELIRAATRGGVEYAFEMAGSQAAMELAYRITRRGGTTVTSGLPHPAVLFSVPHVGIVGEERTIKGSYLGSSNPQRDIPLYIQQFHQGTLPVQRLLSSTLALDDINAAFDALASGVAVRQIVVF